MATATATANVAAAATTAAASNKNNNNNNIIISEPIKIPLSERFSTQTSTGSADSGCIVTSSASQKQLCSGSGSQQQLPPVRSSSGSLSLHGPLPKWQRKQQRQQRKQQQLLLLSQDSGIEQRGVIGEEGGSSSVGAGGGQSNSSSESLGSSSGTEQVVSAAAAAAAADGRTRAASALELSSVGVGVSSGSMNALRRIKYKSTNSTGTQGFDVEDRIDEVDIDQDDVDDDEEDDGVAVDGDVDVDEDDTQSGIVINIASHVDEEQQRLLAAQAAKIKAEEELPLELAPLTVAAAAAKRRDIRNLGTDGRIYFPLLKISEDPHIDAKLINRKDGLQDTMYYLDEFGSPKLREKFARKQKQRLAKQQKAMLKREREEQRKKRNTTVASNLAASGLDDDTKDDQLITTTTTTSNKHCDRNRLTINKQISDPNDHHNNDDDDDDDPVACGVKMRVRSHSHDNHYDGSRKPSRSHNHASELPDAGYVDDNDVDVDDGYVETGAEAESALHDSATSDCLESVKTAKLARTQSCVSWTKVVQKFKHILGKSLTSLKMNMYQKL